ncbi:tetratricopeptide repeat protein [Amorphus sp. MBR-141]
MTDIFQEVEEDLRRERMRSLWDRFGIYVVVVAVLIVAVTAGYRGYIYFQTKAEQAAGDQFLTALDTAAAGDSAAAAEALTEFAQSAPGDYPILARFRAASELALSGDTEAAVSRFDALAADGGLSQRQRDLARVRAGYVLLDTGDKAGIEDRLTGVATEVGAWRNSAREILGIAAYQDGDYAAAEKWFGEIDMDPAAPQDLKARVQLFMGLINGSRAAPAASEAASADDSGTAAPQGGDAAGAGASEVSK